MQYVAIDLVRRDAGTFFAKEFVAIDCSEHVCQNRFKRPFPLTCETFTEHPCTMHRPIQVEALPNFRIHVVYPDGAEGDIDLSADVGRGVFAPLADEAFFRTVHLGQFGQIAWSEDIEICPDAAYLEITGRSVTEAVHA